MLATPTPSATEVTFIGLKLVDVLTLGLASTAIVVSIVASWQSIRNTPRPDLRPQWWQHSPGAATVTFNLRNVSKESAYDVSVRVLTPKVPNMGEWITVDELTSKQPISLEIPVHDSERTTGVYGNAQARPIWGSEFVRPVVRALGRQIPKRERPRSKTFRYVPEQLAKRVTAGRPCGWRSSAS